MIRRMIRDNDAELWMTAIAHRESVLNEHGVPEPVAHLEASMDVIIRLYHDGKAVLVHLLKDHDNPNISSTHVALDPVTMLLIKD